MNNKIKKFFELVNEGVIDAKSALHNILENYLSTNDAVDFIETEYESDEPELFEE